MNKSSIVLRLGSGVKDRIIFYGHLTNAHSLSKLLGSLRKVNGWFFCIWVAVAILFISSHFRSFWQKPILLTFFQKQYVLTLTHRLSLSNEKPQFLPLLLWNHPLYTDLHNNSCLHARERMNFRLSEKIASYGVITHSDPGLHPKGVYVEWRNTSLPHWSPCILLRLPKLLRKLASFICLWMSHSLLDIDPKYLFLYKWQNLFIRRKIVQRRNYHCQFYPQYLSYDVFVQFISMFIMCGRWLY